MILEAEEGSKKAELCDVSDTKAENSKIRVFPEEVESEFYLSLLSEASSAGCWTDKSVVESLLASLSNQTNLVSFQTILDPMLFSNLLLSTEDPEIQRICAEILIKVTKNEPDKYIEASNFLIFSGFEAERLNIISYGLTILHLIFTKSSTIPEFALTSEMFERLNFLIRLTKPFIIKNALIVISDILKHEGPVESFDFNRIVTLSCVDNASVQCKALEALFVMLNRIAEVPNPTSLLQVFADLVERGQYEVKVLSLKCFSVLMESRKEASLEIIENCLIDTIVELISTNNDAGTTAMSVLLKVMRMCESDEQLSGFADIISSESCTEALESIIEKGDSLMAEHAKLILDYVNRIITDE